MDRRAAGIVAFAVVLLTLATMSSLVAPPRSGVAVRAAAPDPPAVGSCGDLTGPELVVADCTQTHAVEVAYTWSAGDPAAGPRPTFAVCTEKVRAYVGSAPAQDTEAHPPGRWSLPLRYRHVIASGPGGTNLGSWSWQACLVAPMGPAPWSGYTGQVRNVRTTGPISASLRVCYANPGSVNTVVSCSVPHTGEVLATQPLPAGASAETTSSAANRRQASCEATARMTTGAADPTFHGQLRVAVFADGGGHVRQPFTADIGVYYTAAGLSWLVCVAESVSNRRLTDSVAGIGNSVLPFG